MLLICERKPSSGAMGSDPGTARVLYSRRSRPSLPHRPWPQANSGRHVCHGRPGLEIILQLVCNHSLKVQPHPTPEQWKLARLLPAPAPGPFLQFTAEMISPPGSLRCHSLIIARVPTFIQGAMRACDLASGVFHTPLNSKDACFITLPSPIGRVNWPWLPQNHRQKNP